MHVAQHEVLPAAEEGAQPPRPSRTRHTDGDAMPAEDGGAGSSPAVIQVLGRRPIPGRRLVRAPWAEPLAAFAGVIVETRLVPDEWLTVRHPAAPVPSAPAPLANVASGSVRVLERPRAPVPRTAAAPIDRVTPAAGPVVPPPARRGLLCRSLVFVVGLVVSFVALEAAARVGRR